MGGRKVSQTQLWLAVTSPSPHPGAGEMPPARPWHRLGSKMPWLHSEPMAQPPTGSTHLLGCPQAFGEQQLGQPILQSLAPFLEESGVAPDLTWNPRCAAGTGKLRQGDWWHWGLWVSPGGCQGPGEGLRVPQPCSPPSALLHPCCQAGVRDRHFTWDVTSPVHVPRGWAALPLLLEQFHPGKGSIFPSPPRCFPGAQGKPAFPELWGWLRARLPAQDGAGLLPQPCCLC